MRKSRTRRRGRPQEEQGPISRKDAKREKKRIRERREKSEAQSHAKFTEDKKETAGKGDYIDPQITEITRIKDEKIRA